MSAPKKVDGYWNEVMNKALEKDPPVILWRKKPNGVRVHVSVYDPHPDGGHNAEKALCKRGHEYTPENTMITPEGWRQCRTCKNERRRVTRPECTDENLLSAARTEL